LEESKALKSTNSPGILHKMACFKRKVTLKIWPIFSQNPIARAERLCYYINKENRAEL
jgi:hypothetical protein